MGIINGTNQSNTLNGDQNATPDSDTIYGLGGNDTIYGGFLNDTLYGGDDNDRLYGGSGSDLFFGENGDDIFYSVAVAGSSSDIEVFDGGSGNDKIEIQNITSVPVTVHKFPVTGFR